LKTDNLEKELLDGLASNDKKAIETIYTENYKMVQALIINNNGSEDDARDIFQEALIVLYEKVKSGSFELSCQIKTYLYAVSRRLWLKKLKYQKRFYRKMDDAAGEVAVEDDLEIHEKSTKDFEIMSTALQELGEPCKTLLETYYLQKKNMQEIAEEFGYTNAENAKNQKYKCLMRLKKIFFDHYKKKES
jgi:RNA polymerase sigma factor (sigma-70 family)